MSSPTLPRAPAPANPMRQQLDELDNLLQRMLSLPVNQLDDAAEVVLPAPQPAAPNRPAPRPTPTALEQVNKSAYPSLAEMPEAAATAPADAPASPKVTVEPPAKLRGPFVVYQPMNAPDMMTLAPLVDSKPPQQLPVPPAAAVDSKNWGPAVDTPPPAPEPAPASEPVPVESLPPLPEARSPFLERHQARLRKQREAAAPLRPVSWLNSFFDRLAVALGGPFLWLIRPEMRSFLGWVGIALLLAALVILAGDWLGWSWPS